MSHFTLMSRWIRLVALTGFLLAVSVNVLGQSEDQLAEYRIKAAFLYQFPRFIEWPPAAFPGQTAPIVIGVIGADSLADELTKIISVRNVPGRPIVVRKLKRGDLVDGLHILFVGRTESARSGEVLLTASRAPILTVSESDEAPVRGAVITFVVVDDKVRFDVRPELAQMNGLKISSRLLTVARNITSRVP